MVARHKQEINKRNERERAVYHPKESTIYLIVTSIGTAGLVLINVNPAYKLMLYLW
jgi:hypothetical protein